MRKNADRNVMSRSKRLLILIMSAVIAVALAVTCGICLGTGVSKATTSGVDDAGVSTSAAKNLSTAGTYDYTAAGAINNNDTINMSYCGGVYTIKLTKGTYKFEVWGAQGGASQTSRYSNTGGQGGYSTGVYKITDTSKTLYVVVGGQGGSSSSASGGGGGATHIATMTGLLNNIGESNKGQVIIVAGGGGGNGGNDGVGYGQGGTGGGTNGGDGACVPGKSDYGKGGTQTAGGGATAFGSKGAAEGQGKFGAGGYDSGYTLNNTGGYNGGGSGNGEEGGGGGAGWYGGGTCKSGSYGGGGGGGSGYIGGVTSSTVNGTTYTATMSNGSQSGNGKAVITALQVNQAPVQQAYPETTAQPIGTSSKTIYSYQLAQDTDYANQSGANANSVYYVNGAATTAADVAGNATTGLYLNAQCTVSANTYIDYKFTNNQTLVINGYLKQPRANVAGATENNKLTVYVGIRDSYGGSSTTYARGVYSFVISFSGITATGQSGSKTSGNYTFRYGASTTQNSALAASGAIYSPKTVGTWSLCVQQPIIKNTSVTVNAADLLAITAPAATNKSYFKAILVPSGAVSGLFSYSGTTATFNSASTGYTSLTITATGASANWQNVTFTLYMVENTTAGNVANTEPVGITYSNRTFDVSFRVDNTRPTLRSSKNNVVDVAVGSSADVKLNDYFYDIDGDITTSTHQILGVEVPRNEFVQLDKYGNVTSTYGASGANTSSYYNVGGGSITSSLTTGKSTVATTFDENIASPAVTPNAFVSYNIKSNDTLTLTGLRPSYSQYSDTRASATAYTGGSTASATTSGAVSDPGHFYLLLHIRDNNDVDDVGIYLPIAIRVGYSAGLGPVNTGSSTGSSVANQGMLSDMPHAIGEVGDTFYFVPMGLNFGGTEYPVGKIVDNGNVISVAGTNKNQIQALALDGDNFSNADGLSVWSNKLNEFLTITSVPSGVSANDRAVDYADISTVDVYVPQSCFGGRVRVGDVNSRDTTTGVNTINLTSGAIAGDATAYYVTTGIKITLKSATMNRYFYVNVPVRDSAQNPVTGGVDIAINVGNTDPDVIDEDDIAKYKNSTYNYNGTITLSYRVPMRSTFFITPYDLVSDINMLDGGAKYPDGGFTLNGLSGKYASSAFTVGAAAGEKETSVNALYSTAAYGSGNASYMSQLTEMLDNLKNQKQTVDMVATGYAVGTPHAQNTNILNDRLFFTRTSDTTSDAFTFDPATVDFVYSVTNVADYVDISVGNSVTINGISYGIDFLMFSAVTRTATDAEINLTVRDRYGLATIPVKIKISIVNTPPEIKELDTVPELAVSAKDEDGNSIRETSLVVTPDAVMKDHDGDKLVYVQSRGILVARGNIIKDIETLVDLGTADNHPEYADLLCDENGNSLTTYYLKAVMDSTGEFTVTALGSTKSITDGVYVYFFVTDSRGGTTLGYLPIEVINTSPVFNTSDTDGFSGEDRLWSLESARDADIYRSRYIVGSENARRLLKEKETATDENILLSATDADIKLIATDADVLQGLSGVVLSQRGFAPTNYVNYSSSYDAAVPSINNNKTFAEQTAAVIVSRVNDNGKVEAVPNTVNIQLLFYVNGEWYSRNDLIGAIGTTISHNDVFENNRWKVRDWALRITADQAFTGYKLRITFSIRDVAEYGGDTAGVPTAYKSDRRTGENENVLGYLDVPDVFMYISGTGIRTKDDYNVYGNNYVVEYEPKAGATANYLVTKDGDTVSAEPYTAANAASAVGKFEYLSTITVPASADGSKSYETVYVPMSYFGQQKAIVAPDASNGGAVKYKDTFVGYDMRTGNDDNKQNSAYDISAIDNIASAISLYDGTTTWTGSGGARPLRDNPYLEIASADYTASMNGAEYFSGNAVGAYAGSSDYYNTQLAVSTADSAYAADSAYIYGTDNRLIYLENQATKLLEHNFGLSFKKKDVRTGSTNLILTVDLALSEVSRDGANAITAINTACTEESDARSVSVSIRVENTPVDLATDGTLKYDGTYYVDVTMSTSSSDAFALLRKDTDSVAGYNKIYYTDNDYGNADYRDTAYFSLDSINELSQSLNAYPSDNADGVFTNTTQSAVGGVYRAQRSMMNYYGVSDLADVNTDGAYSANTGKYGYTSYFNVTTSENGKIINIKASRKTYINESALKQIVADEFASNALFNGFGWDDNYVYGGLSYKQLTAIYASRGLRVVFGDVNKVDNDSTNIIPDDQSLRVYYPLKVLVYDTFGAGWNDASYVAMEFRIRILNTTPTINKDNLTYNGTLKRWEKRTKLAVNSTMYLELEKYISDPDIYTVNSQLATVTQFKTRARGVDRETGDYLESPFSYNFTNERMTQSALLSKNAGLSVQGFTDTDVIMYMEVEKRVDDKGNLIVEPVSSSSIPSNNRLWFKVNRRTSDDSGNILNEFEFTLNFRDNHHSNATPSETESITFIIEVENQAPVIETKVTRVTMHTGDYLVLLPAYYDTFIGGEEYYTGKTDIDDFESDHIGPYALPKEGSPAYLKSKTYTEYYRSRITEGADWKFYEITSAKYANDAIGDLAFKTDTSAGTGGENLGFLGVANDDAPWRMRFEPASYAQYNFVNIIPQNRVYAETNNDQRAFMPTALLITASRACTQRPVTFTVVDGEGGSVIYTIEFTIISAPPRALNPNIPGELSRIKTAHLEGIVNTNAGQGAQYLNNGKFNTYIIPSGGANGVDVNLSSGIGKKTAYKETEIRLNNVATDPDDGEATLSLHGNGYFRVNGQDLVENENGHYLVPGVTNYFYITKTDNTRFTIHATGYNPTSSYETLTFRVADPGNDVYANSIEITIYIYTIYSDMENPTVGKLQPGEYSDVKQGYLAGSNAVHVKPYDEYLGIGAYANNDDYKNSVGRPTVYNYIFFAGGDADGNTDGTASSPIVDRDVSAAGTMTYAAYVYAFMEKGTALTSAQIDELLVRKGNAFAIDPEKKNDVNDKYLIGGINLQGSAISSNAISASALGEINSYFNFTVAADGASISFIPKTATFDKKLMLYVEVQKRIGTTREATRTDDAICAGTLFSLVVDDSAPRNVKVEGQSYNRAFVGYKGSSVTYRIYGGTRGEALFEDSDAGDVISIDVDNNNVNNKWYRDALELALEQDGKLDWNVNAATGKERAITVTVDGEYVTITINRRMDKVLPDGTYAAEVTFPLVLTCTDRGEKQDSAIIQITVCNTPLTSSNVIEGEHIDARTGVGYTFVRNTSSQYDNEYILNASVMKGTDLTVNLTDILDDPDYKLGGNTDSYKFVKGGEGDAHQSNFAYLLDTPEKAIYYTDIEYGEYKDLATVTPIYTKYLTDFNYTGFTINAESSVRNSTGSLRIHIVDRAGNADSDSEGIYVTLRITVINTPPEVIEGMDGYTIDILGSDTATIGKTFAIKDFVKDRNESDVADMEAASKDEQGTETWLRIYTITYSYYTEINTTDKAKLPDGGATNDGTSSAGYADDSSLIFTVSDSEQDTGNKWEQAFNIRPNVGFYGSGEFIVTVADGNMNEYSDTEFVSFRVRVNVIYNPSDITGMELAPMAKGKKRTVTITDLIKDIDNTFNSVIGQNNIAGRANSTFNPASWYTLISINPTNEAKEYVEAIKTADGEWTLHALAVTAPSTKRVNVVYALKSDMENSVDGTYPTYSSYFNMRINENQRPTLIYKTMTFERYAEEGTIDSMFKLDSGNSVYLYPEQLFNDPENDVMSIVSVKSNKESLVSAYISDDKDRIVIKFSASGTAELTITVSDESGANYTYEKIIVTNTDLPEPDLWTRFLASLESNKVMWAIIFAAIILAIIILIIIIAVVKKRKREREELEALLVSEMEIEEQMLRLAGGPAPTGYQSYGYLQAPGQPSVDPGLMLGAGMNTPNIQQLELAAPPVQPTNTAQPFVSPNEQGFDDLDNF